MTAPKHHLACPAGIAEALKLPTDAPCRCAGLAKIDAGTPKRTVTGEVPLTFSGRRGSQVLSLGGRKPVVELKVGDQVLVPSMFGYFLATVTVIDPIEETLAESKGLYFPLFPQGGVWWCGSAISKEAVER